VYSSLFGRSPLSQSEQNEVEGNSEKVELKHIIKIFNVLVERSVSFLKQIHCQQYNTRFC